MFSTDDPWPDYITGPTKHLHALGVIALHFNLLEQLWGLLLQLYAGQKTAEFLLLGKVADERRIATIRHYAKVHERDPAVINCIEYATSAYAICAENRNILMHSHQFFTRNLADVLSLQKRSKQGATLKFHFSLDDLRRVADEMMETYDYLHHIIDYIDDRDVVSAATLPGKPRSPRKLDPGEILEVP